MRSVTCQEKALISCTGNLLTGNGLLMNTTDYGYENNPHNANLFVNRKGMVGMIARDTIVALAGELPPFYD